MNRLIKIAIFSLIVSSCTQSSNDSTNSNSIPSSNTEIPITYEEKVKSVEEIEKEEPTRFLNASGTYRNNFWGNKVIIEGNIQNNATVASYKDIIVEVIFYSKTDSEIEKQNYTIYEYCTPNQSKDFKLKIKKVDGTVKCSLNVISATPL